MRLGALELQIVPDGSFRLDGGAMFGVVPKALCEKKARPDERNRVLAHARAPHERDRASYRSENW
jgi:hypothetical protein